MIDPTFQTGQLEAIRFGLEQHLDPYFIDRIDIQEASEALQYMGSGVGYQFRTQIWADKLADETHTVTQEVKTHIDVPVYNSAWQLWKANHQDSKLFGWIARRWPPEKRGTEVHSKTRQARIDFNVKKHVAFPDFNPAVYPDNFGSYYRYVQTYPGRLFWE